MRLTINEKNGLLFGVKLINLEKLEIQTHYSKNLIDFGMEILKGEQMGSTLSNLLYHIVFHTKNNKPFLQNIKNELYQYIAGIVKGEDGKLVAINGISDHIHIVVLLRPKYSISEIVKKIKGNSSKWINENQKIAGHFSWQTGYGVFSVSQSQLPVLINYIKNQENHHKIKTFKEEYIAFLEKHDIEFDEKYLWK